MICKNKNKFISSIIAFILTIICGVTIFGKASVSADNSSLQYVKYNAQTGAYLGSYSLSSMSSYNNNRSIIGLDSRVIDWSKSGVVKLMNSSNYLGTGFVVGEHVIATAGHCAKGSRITEILLFNSNGTIAMHATPVESHFLKAYDNAHSTENDYALITVEEDLSSYMCFDLAASVNVTNKAVNITGFPQEYNNHYTHAMYTGTGNIQSMATKTLTYNVDTTGGNSGSPVYLTESYNGHTYNSVVAIHTTGGGSLNTGTRITFDLLHFYMNNDNLNY